MSATVTDPTQPLAQDNEPIKPPPPAERARIFVASQIADLKAKIHAAQNEAAGLKQQDQKEVLAEVQAEIAFDAALAGILQAGLDVTAPSKVAKPVQGGAGK